MKINEAIAVITGGASGLGEACAREIVNNGGRVAIFDIQTEIGEQISRELGENAVFIKTDVTEDESVRKSVSKVLEKFRCLNVAINCAGIGSPCKVLGKEGPMALEFFNLRIQVNLVGTMRVLIYSAEQMAKNTPNDEGERGVIINTSSLAATQGQIGQAAYSASKGGIEGLMPPVAKELARHGIRVMTIAPGLFHTPMMDKLPVSVVEALSKSVPFPKRTGHPSEYARLAKNIIENPYINGEVFKITGSLRMV